MHMQTVSEHFNLPARDDLRAHILDALDLWIRQRPGLDPRNYIRDWRDADGVRAYKADARAITRDLHHARALLRYVELRPSITGERLLEAFGYAFGGRLMYTPGRGLDYTTGQYWPMEYRRAACAVLASAIWDYLREGMSEPTGDKLRAAARRELGAAIARRWFR